MKQIYYVELDNEVKYITEQYINANRYYEKNTFFKGKIKDTTVPLSLWNEGKINKENISKWFK
jgi:hypothetical protein